MPDPIEIRQPGDYCYTYSPFHKPIATVKPGQRVAIETLDAFENKLNSPEDMCTEKCHFPFLNPQTGPIVVEGAEPGDTLVVHLHDITPTRDFAVTAILPSFGGLTSTTYTRTLNEPLEEETRLLPIDMKAREIHFNEKIRLPYEPFVGTIGVAPQIEAVNSLTPCYWGGNMDCVDTCPGNAMHFPVHIDGAHFFVGDAHATQGDGEITGVACEIPARVEVTFELIKGKTIAWPRIENDDYIMTTGSTRPLDDALRIASCELIEWMVADYGFSQRDAYHLLGQTVKYRVGNMVDPNYTVVAKMAKRYLAS